MYQTLTQKLEPDQTGMEDEGCCPRVVVYRGEEGFATLADEWNDLLRRSRFDTLFLTWEWQTTWWRHLGEGELHLLAFREQDGALAGIAPLYLTHKEDNVRRFAIVGCVEVSDYLDIIVQRGCEAGVYRALLTWLRSPDAPTWDEAYLCNLPEPSLSYRGLARLAEQVGFEVEVGQEDVCPVAPLPDSFDAYLAGLDKKQRHELRRKMRRIEREGQAAFEVIGPEDDLVAAVEDFIALHQASRPDKDQFMTSQMRGFFHAVARVMHDLGQLQLSFLRLNGKRAASLLSFDYSDTVLVYNSGYDPNAFYHLSPGWVLIAYNIQYAIARGRRYFDFLQGDEEYKYHFGGQDLKVMRLVIRNRGQG